MSRIPLLKFFFARTDADQDQSEIIVFLTPHIISGEEMRAWDRKGLKDFPSHTWPENRGYDEPQVKLRKLKEDIDNL